MREVPKCAKCPNARSAQMREVPKYVDRLAPQRGSALAQFGFSRSGTNAESLLIPNLFPLGSIQPSSAAWWPDPAWYAASRI